MKETEYKSFMTLYMEIIREISKFRNKSEEEVILSMGKLELQIREEYNITLNMDKMHYINKFNLRR